LFFSLYYLSFPSLPPSATYFISEIHLAGRKGRREEGEKGVTPKMPPNKKHLSAAAATAEVIEYCKHTSSFAFTFNTVRMMERVPL
jgi:hypothetical protein